jgi:hypothetical protein
VIGSSAFATSGGTTNDSSAPKLGDVHATSASSAQAT